MQINLQWLISVFANNNSNNLFWKINTSRIKYILQWNTHTHTHNYLSWCVIHILEKLMQGDNKFEASLGSNSWPCFQGKPQIIYKADQYITQPKFLMLLLVIWTPVNRKKNSLIIVISPVFWVFVSFNIMYLAESSSILLEMDNGQSYNFCGLTANFYRMGTSFLW